MESFLIPGLLLIAAAGGAAYYFLVYRKNPKTVAAVPKPRDVNQAVKHAKDKIDHASDHNHEDKDPK